MSPFDFVNSVNFTKKYIINDENESTYAPYLTNRSLSYFKDSVLLANEMNIKHQLDNKLQYDFLINTLRKRKRFSKWLKSETNESIVAIKEYFNYSEEKASDALKLLTEEQVNIIKYKVSKGGRK